MNRKKDGNEIKNTNTNTNFTTRWLSPKHFSLKRKWYLTFEWIFTKEVDKNNRNGSSIVLILQL
jgi:hypothetical protein